MTEVGFETADELKTRQTASLDTLYLIIKTTVLQQHLGKCNSVSFRHTMASAMQAGRTASRAFRPLSSRQPANLLRICTTRLTPFSPPAQQQHIRTFTSTTSKMSFSNADTGSKPADPYVAKNIQDPDLKEKVEDLANYVDSKCTDTNTIELPRNTR